MNQARLITWVLKPLVFALALVPLGLLVWRGFAGELSADPIEDVTRVTGENALRLLLITLAVTPMRQLTGWNPLARFRRMLGLFAFFYAALHFTTYVWLEQALDWPAIVEDILERPYITVGFTALVLLVPLAATSTNAMVRRLGGRRWKRLHQLVYVATLLGLLHFLWLVKADTREPLIHLAVFAVLMACRLPVLSRRLPRLRTAAQTG